MPWSHAILCAALVAACGTSSRDGRDAGLGEDDSGGVTERWIDLAPIASGAVQETAVVDVAGQIYVIGGIHGQRGTVADVLTYDPLSDTWGRAQSLPAPLHHVNAAVVGGKIYVLGGLRGDFSAVGTSWVYDPATDAWDSLADMPPGTERGAAAVGVLGGIVYLAGGQDGATSSAMASSYDPDGDLWDVVAIPELPAPRNHLVGAAFEGALYVIGGRDGALESAVDVWRPGAPTWSPATPMPTARAGMAAGIIGDEIVVVGGEGNEAPGTQGVFAEAEAYDPATDTWRRLPEMTLPRHGMGAVGIDRRLFVPGGADVQGVGAVASHQALELSPR